VRNPNNNKTHADFQQYDEKIENILLTDSIMEKEKYMKIHDGVCAQIHSNVRKKVLAKPDDEKWHEHVPKPVGTSHEYKVNVLWNQQVKTDRTHHNNKPDIMYCGSDI
jgi:hypothetical protein